MNKSIDKVYEDAEVLKKIIQNLQGRKFLLDCGHKVTFGLSFGNNITIFNGKEIVIICSLCGY